jgi:hypothetical protein
MFLTGPRSAFWAGFAVGIVGSEGERAMNSGRVKGALHCRIHAQTSIVFAAFGSPRADCARIRSPGLETGPRQYDGFTTRGWFGRPARRPKAIRDRGADNQRLACWKKRCGPINRCRRYSFLIADSGCVCGGAYLISAGPRQACVWGSRTRPLPQPPMRSPGDIVGVGSEGAIPAVTVFGNAGLV